MRGARPYGRRPGVFISPDFAAIPFLPARCILPALPVRQPAADGAGRPGDRRDSRRFRQRPPRPLPGLTGARSRLRP
jgi:hypothetical protein